MSARAKKKSSVKGAIEITKGKSRHSYVFIHDIGFDKRMWFPLLTDIGNDVRAIAYDLDGFGARAATTLPAHTIEYHVEDLFQTLDRARVKSPILIGLRFGAHVALHALRRDAARFHGIVIGGALPYAPTIVEHSECSAMVAALADKESAHYADTLIAHLDIDQDNSSQLRHQISAHSAHNIAATLVASLARVSALHALLDFEHPVVMMSGQGQEERLQKEFINISLQKENMTIIRIPESTTLYNIENPRAFRSACMRFIQSFEA